MRLIDADRLYMQFEKRMMFEKHRNHAYLKGVRDCMKDVEQMPTIKSEHNKGTWIKIPEFCGDDVSGFIDNHFSCSECKKEAEINPWGFYVLSDYCPNCGADMREGGEE